MVDVEIIKIYRNIIQFFQVNDLRGSELQRVKTCAEKTVALRTLVSRSGQMEPLYIVFPKYQHRARSDLSGSNRIQKILRRMVVKKVVKRECFGTGSWGRNLGRAEEGEASNWDSYEVLLWR
jgi:hypothetical protein